MGVGNVVRVISSITNQMIGSMGNCGRNRRKMMMEIFVFCGLDRKMEEGRHWCKGGVCVLENLAFINSIL